MKSPVFANAGGGGRERAERMVGARPESMLAMLEMVEKKWGGAEGYVRNVCELSQEEVEKVKAVLTVKQSAVPQKRMSKVFDTSKKFLKGLWKSIG
jgi:hypothetical protein